MPKMLSVDKEQHNNDHDSDDSNNKINKLDNSNDEIDITTLSNQTIIQLTNISESLGIPIEYNITREELIEMIKSVYKRKQNTLQKQLDKDNMNSFTQGIIGFTIKDGIDETEWSFWKIFRNIFIFKRIMSFMDKRLTPDYDSIICVNGMIKSKQFSMLRDKVIRNQYLVFRGPNREDEDDRTVIHNIFKSFKNDDDQDRLFHKHFFKYYSNYIFEFNAISMDKELIFDSIRNKEQLINNLIFADCLPALQILFQQYQYQPTELNLKCAIDFDIIKYIKLFLKLQPQLKESIHQIISNINKPIISIFKSLYYLHNEGIINIRAINNSKTNRNILSSLSDFQINESISLELLIITGKLICLYYSSSIEINKHIESFSNCFNEQELKLPLSYPSFQNQYKKDNILKILDLYYTIVGTKPDYYYYLYFKCDEYDGDFGSFSKSLQFGNLKLFENIFNGINYDCNTISIRHLNGLLMTSTSSKPLLFSHCFGETNKEKRLNFLNSIITKNNNNNNNNNNQFLYHLLLFIIDYNDIDLLKSLKSPFNGIDNSNRFKCNFQINQFIKSIEMLDYLFLNYNQLFTTINIWHFKTTQLLKHYESLNLTKNPGNGFQIRGISTQDLKYSFSLNNSPNEIIQYIFEQSSSVYYISREFDQLHMYNMIDKCCTTVNIAFKLMKLLFIKYQIIQDSNGNFNYVDLCDKKIYFLQIREESLAFIKFLDWVFINYNNYLKFNYSTISKNHQDGILISVFNRTGRLDQLKENIPISTILENIPTVKYIKTLEFICNRLKLTISLVGTDDKKCKDSIRYIFNGLANSSKKGELNMLMYVQHHHPWLFSKENLTNLKRLLFISLSNSHLLQADFFFEFLSISEKEFDTYATDITKVYFKNKKFHS